ncbi:hypothetical protein [Brachybacterium sacelli]|uniref:Uncharacterized protein n=1 Tax=Brachybacterium sacelli TaxID=173364 RepID=A0ABS4X0N5_9MICO|nr:hypothetical protein [Brachybacterium sacelli]MBP2382015.1 hypothetical protein [Brachybacterium sacelli]
MADWKTYAKAARNTARKQAPGARDAAQRATSRASGYVKAAGRAVDEGRRGDDAPRREEDASRREDTVPRRPETRADEEDRTAGDRVRASEPADGARRRPSAEDSRGTRGASSLREDAKIYATVAGRTAQRAGTRAREAGIGARILRAVRDALLIGGSLFVIWGVLYLAGLPIPFSAVLIAAAVVVAIALATSLYAQFRRRPGDDDLDHEPDDA